MAKLNNPEFHILMQLVNSCIHFGKTYIIQSIPTQQALILKASGEWIPLSTFNKAIRRLKDGWHYWKQHRTKKIRGIGNVWTSSITYLSWACVIEMRRKCLLTKGHMAQLRRIFDGMKKRGPAKLEAPPAALNTENGKVSQHAFLFPT